MSEINIQKLKNECNTAEHEIDIDTIIDMAYSIGLNFGKKTEFQTQLYKLIQDNLKLKKKLFGQEETKLENFKLNNTNHKINKDNDFYKTKDYRNQSTINQLRAEIIVLEGQLSKVIKN